jgi:hypothetical protein
MEMESPLTLAYRTPLEDSFVEISTALSTELRVEALLDHILKEARQFTEVHAHRRRRAAAAAIGAQWRSTPP